MYNSRWFTGSSRYLPIYSGQPGCLDHWISWNRGVAQNEFAQDAIEYKNDGEDAKDITYDIVEE